MNRFASFRIASICVFLSFFLSLSLVFTAYNHLSYVGGGSQQLFSTIVRDNSQETMPFSSDDRSDDSAPDSGSSFLNPESSGNSRTTATKSTTIINPTTTTSQTNNLIELEQLRRKVSELERLVANQQKKNILSEVDAQCKPASLLPIYSRRHQFLPTKVLPASEKKRILITGGAGFVGSHLLDRLMAEGHHVIVVDNFYTGRKSNVEHWCGHANFELIRHDIEDWLELERLDEIYHLASPASPPHYMLDSVKTLKTNSLGTINMLELGKKVGAKILIASTSEIYGDPLVHPQSESYWGNVNPIGPRSCYDEGKRFAEAMTYSFLKQNPELQVRVSRIFNTYGPRMHIKDGRVVSNFINQALDGKPLTIYGNGTQTRSFQYVDDLVDGLIGLMAANYSGPVNLGNPDEYSINQFAYIVLDLVHKNSTKRLNDYPLKIGETTGNPSRSTLEEDSNDINDYTDMIVHYPAPVDDPQRRRPDISLAKRVLNWQPNILLAEGLRKTINYFRAELKQQQPQQTSQRIGQEVSMTIK